MSAPLQDVSHIGGHRAHGLYVDRMLSHIEVATLATIGVLFLGVSVFLLARRRVVLRLLGLTITRNNLFWVDGLTSRLSTIENLTKTHLQQMFQALNTAEVLESSEKANKVDLPACFESSRVDVQNHRVQLCFVVAQAVEVFVICNPSGYTFHNKRVGDLPLDENCKILEHIADHEYMPAALSGIYKTRHTMVEPSLDTTVVDMDLPESYDDSHVLVVFKSGKETAQVVHAVAPTPRDSSTVNQLVHAKLEVVAEFALHQNKVFRVMDVFGESEVEAECVICYSDMADVVFLPCRHRTVCMTCFPHLTKCPTCRADINRYLKLVVHGSGSDDATSGGT